jgi:hypothetical protein
MSAPLALQQEATFKQVEQPIIQNLRVKWYQNEEKWYSNYERMETSCQC